MYRKFHELWTCGFQISMQTNKWGKVFDTAPTRKRRQSYRHADPLRQRPQLAQEYAALVIVSSNRATVTVFIQCDLWPFNLWVNACRALLQSIHVPSLVLIAQAVFLLECGQTDASERPTHAVGYAGVGNWIL